MMPSKHSHSNESDDSELMLAKFDSKLFDELLISDTSANENSFIAYMAHSLVQATLPHKKPVSNEFTRKNGKYTLTMLAPSEVGLPYGVIPRLILIWITTEAFLTKNRELTLGRSFNEFMKKINLRSSGGSTGSIDYVKDQTRRLFSTLIHCSYIELQNNCGNVTKEKNLNLLITERSELWWHNSSSFESKVLLSQSFFDEIIKNPIPIDMKAIKRLRKSPMAIDIYMWLTYRNSYLRKSSNVTWPQLKAQIGANYSSNAQGIRDFKKNFRQQLLKVLIVYSDANVTQTSSGILLKPSNPHVPKLSTVNSDFSFGKLS